MRKHNKQKLYWMNENVGHLKYIYFGHFTTHNSRLTIHSHRRFIHWDSNSGRSATESKSGKNEITHPFFCYRFGHTVKPLKHKHIYTRGKR